MLLVTNIPQFGSTKSAGRWSRTLPGLNDSPRLGLMTPQGWALAFKLASVCLPSPPPRSCPLSPRLLPLSAAERPHPDVSARSGHAPPGSSPLPAPAPGPLPARSARPQAEPRCGGGAAGLCGAVRGRAGPSAPLPQHPPCAAGTTAQPGATPAPAAAVSGGQRGCCGEGGGSESPPRPPRYAPG